MITDDYTPIDQSLAHASESDSNSNSSKFWLTTVDNPFNPFTQFDEWFQFDEAKGYCSSGLVARLAMTSSELSDRDNDDEIREAMDWVVANDPLGVYKKVTPLDYE